VSVDPQVPAAAIKAAEPFRLFGLRTPYWICPRRRSTNIACQRDGRHLTVESLKSDRYKLLGTQRPASLS